MPATLADLAVQDQMGPTDPAGYGMSVLDEPPAFDSVEKMLTLVFNG